MEDWLISAPREPAQTAAVTRAYRRRGWAITAVFVAVELVIVLFGAAALEGINVLRAFASGESHWSKAEKSAVIALDRFAAVRDPADYRAFEAAIAVVQSDHAARVALSGSPYDFARAARGFAGGDNDAADIPGLIGGFVLFHTWPPFAAAVKDWARGDDWIGELAALGREMRAAAAQGADGKTLDIYLRHARALDARLSANERGFSVHMNEASREALTMTLALFAGISALVCLGGVLLAWRILRVGMEAEKRATQSEARVRDFAELATDWFCEIDGRFHLAYASSRAPERGDALEILLGHNWLKPGEPEGFTDLSGGHSDAMRLHRPFRDHRFRQDGATARYWSVSGKPLFGAGMSFAGYRTIATDITGFIATQDALSQARDQAQQASRAKSAFLANMSHELRTPLNAILGFSELIAMQVEGGIGDARHAAYAHDIHSSGQHLLSIINDLLDHSRIEAGKLVLRDDPFDVAGAIEGVRLLCGERAAALKVDLQVAVAAAIPAVLGDELRFKQVLINVVTNAIKFAPGGAVVLTAGIDTAGALRLTVEDTGIGMDAAGIAQAMRPFGQVDSGLNRQYEGTGLGVPLSKALTELQGGTFEIASTLGVGTSVTIVLPMRGAERARDVAIAAA
jgi:signal transduction histidine kinase